MAYQSSESRNKLVPSFMDEVSGKLILRDRTPYVYRDSQMNINHTAKSGDTWWSIAARYYYAISDRPAGLWWIIKDYQPVPVVDGTVSIQPGTLVIVPHPSDVITDVIGAEREVYQ